MPNFATTQAIIHIENSDDATVQDVSNAVFRVEACNIVSAFENDVFEVCQNESINFTNTSFNATNFEWYVNANLISTDTDLNYTFTEAGTYLVSLRSINGNCIDDYFEMITVYETPTATFTHIQNDLTINCYAISDNVNNYTWTIDNINVGTASNLEHAFTVDGNYNVCLLSLIHI